MKNKKVNNLLSDLEFQNSIGVEIIIEKKPNNRFKEEKKKKENLFKDTSVEIQIPPPKKERAVLEEPDSLLKKCSSLEQLFELINSFEGCQLKKTATKTVFSDGNPKSKIMFIGEAPGAEEDRIGKPFVGASGQLLDKMFNSINLSRKNVYITNIIPWRPPGNRTPTDYEILLMKPFLLKHIEIINPKILVAVGGSAARAVLGIDGGILRNRGKWDNLKINNNLIIESIATLHPAYLLRSPSQKRLAWEDLKMIRDKLKDYEI